jgi:hypothetical protein
MVGYISLILFFLGWIPWSIHKDQKGKAHSFEIRACFWSFSRKRDERGNRQWRLRLHLVERLQGATWAVIDFFQKNRTGPDA